MSVPDPSRFDQLLSRYLDVSLTEAEEHELLLLLADENLAARFHEATRLDTEIAGVLAGSLPDEVMVSLVWSDLAQADAPAREPIVSTPTAVQPKRKKISGAWLALAAAVAFLLAASAIHFLRVSPTAVVKTSVPATAPNSVPEPTPVPASVARGQFSEIAGDVRFVSAAGQIPLTGDQPVTEGGTIKTIGPDSRATLTLIDGTRIELLGNSSFTVDLQPDKRRLYLAQGILRANVAKQPENEPMVFQTPFASAIVHGTTLALIARDYDSYLIVFKGTVGLQRGSDEQEVMVGTGHYLHVETSGGALTWPIARLPRDVREALQQ